MRAEDFENADLGAVLISACVATCRAEGRRYTETIRNELIAAIAKNRDPAGQLVQTRMLAAVEALIDQQELPLDRVSP